MFEEALNKDMIFTYTLNHVLYKFFAIVKLAKLIYISQPPKKIEKDQKCYILHT